MPVSSIHPPRGGFVACSVGVMFYVFLSRAPELVVHQGMLRGLTRAGGSHTHAKWNGIARIGSATPLSAIGPSRTPSSLVSATKYHVSIVMK